MADVLKLFTQGVMDKATVTSTDAATNFPITNAVNGNLDNWWKPLNASGNKDILIDLGTVQSINATFLRIRNLTTTLGEGMTVSVSYSSDASTYTAVPSFAFSATAEGDYLIDFTAAASFRYWRIRFASITTVPEVVMAAICKKNSITHPSDPPRRNPRRFYTEKYTDQSGRSTSSLMNRRAQKSFVRSFTIVNSAHYDALMAAFEDSQGSVLPLILQEDSGTPYVVKLLDDIANWPEFTVGIWSVQMTFEELPFIAVGELY